MSGRAVGEILAAILVLTAIAFGVAMCMHSAGCAIWQHEDARQAAEFGCVERYKTRDQIEACREVVNDITSKYAKDAGGDE